MEGLRRLPRALRRRSGASPEMPFFDQRQGEIVQLKDLPARRPGERAERVDGGPQQTFLAFVAPDRPAGG